MSKKTAAAEAVEANDNIQGNEGKQIVILLPSYNPDDKLVACVNSLLDAGFKEIIVVDDGSKEECQKYFDEVSGNVHLVRHAVNQGKGRALKTGLNFAKLNYKDNLLGIIAADGDGQHPVSAILDCKYAMIKYPDKLILGVRRFFGITHIKFSDTQCGLRGFSVGIINDMIATHGERFEYENIMLIDVRKKNIDFVEVPMDAVYIEDNQTSHFNKITDSVIIYRNILKFALFPIIAGLIGFFFSYIYFLNLGCLAERNIILTYSAGALLSWLILSFTIKNEKKSDILFMVLWIAASTGIFFAAFKWLFDYPAAWWLSALIIAPVSYALYLRARYGRKPKRIKYKK